MGTMRKREVHKVSIGEETIRELASRGEITLDRTGRVFGLNGYITRALRRDRK